MVMVKERSVVVFLRTRCRWMDSSRGDGNGGYGSGLLKGSHREGELRGVTEKRS